MDFISQDEAKIKIREWLSQGQGEDQIKNELSKYGFVEMVIDNLIKRVKWEESKEKEAEEQANLNKFTQTPNPTQPIKITEAKNPGKGLFTIIVILLILAIAYFGYNLYLRYKEAAEYLKSPDNGQINSGMDLPSSTVDESILAETVLTPTNQMLPTATAAPTVVKATPTIKKIVPTIETHFYSLGQVTIEEGLKCVISLKKVVGNVFTIGETYINNSDKKYDFFTRVQMRSKTLGYAPRIGYGISLSPGQRISYDLDFDTLGNSGPFEFFYINSKGEDVKVGGYN